jgi:hypothetical protein
MRRNDHDDGDAGENLLGHLPREVPPPPHVEARVMRQLRANRHLARRHGRHWVVAAAALAAFAIGWVGAGGSLPRTTPERRYILLLYAGDATRTESESGSVEEYRRWAQTVRAGRREVSGERLEDRGIAVLGSPASVPFAPVLGYFVIEAADDGDALAIARRHPHLRRGGRIVVQRIMPT